jgi:hypothetical protein
MMADVLPIREQAESQQDRDPINPPHYNRGGLQEWDILRAYADPDCVAGPFGEHLRMCALEYAMRAPFKHTRPDMTREQKRMAMLEDVMKAEANLRRLARELCRRDA